MKLLIKILVVFFAFYLPQITIAADIVAENREKASLEESLPPEVQSLIGMQIPPVVKNRARARIPNFIQNNGNGGGVGDIVYEFGVVNGRWPVFVVAHIDKNLTTKILDIQMLPANLIDWRFENGEFIELKGRFHMSSYCKSNEDDKRIIVGLMKPERAKSGCVHLHSKRVNRAWEIDEGNGLVTPISTQELYCVYDGELENQCE